MLLRSGARPLDAPAQQSGSLTTELTNRLPFGISPCTSNFSANHGLSHTMQVVYGTNLIVTGEGEAQHVSNLHKTLSKLKRCGVKLKKSVCHLAIPNSVFSQNSRPPWINPSIARQG